MPAALPHSISVSRSPTMGTLAPYQTVFSHSLVQKPRFRLATSAAVFFVVRADEPIVRAQKRKFTGKIVAAIGTPRDTRLIACDKDKHSARF